MFSLKVFGATILLICIHSCGKNDEDRNLDLSGTWSMTEINCYKNSITRSSQQYYPVSNTFSGYIKFHKHKYIYYAEDSSNCSTKSKGTFKITSRSGKDSGKLKFYASKEGDSCEFEGIGENSVDVPINLLVKSGIDYEITDNEIVIESFSDFSGNEEDDDAACTDDCYCEMKFVK